MKKFRLKRLLGKKYLLNLNTKEIHDLSAQHVNCHIALMADHNRQFISRKTAKKLLEDSQYDGCRFCMKDKDNG